MAGAGEPAPAPAGDAAGRRGLTLAPTARQALWLQRMREDLPAAAATHPDWPIRRDHCFGRVILDTVCGAPWREVLAPPAWRNLSPERLEAAIACADAILSGDADLRALNDASLALRRHRREDPAMKALASAPRP